jgi:nucleoside phosphorylase
MVGTFPSLRFGLLVGIGGGIPTNGVRLGDVVVSVPSGIFPGVVQWDMGKAENGKFVRTGALNKPPSILLAAQKKLEANFLLRREGLDKLLSSGPHELCNPPSLEGNEGCQYVKDVKIHYGLIASGSQVIKDARIRDMLNIHLDEKVLCIEMEAAGLPDNFPCLVIRGISDLADAQKEDSWQPYAAMVAAAYAKRLLQQIVPQDVKEQILIQEHLGESKSDLRNV